MAKETIASNCFLCGSIATCTDTDSGNRKFYLCSNEACGDFEISNAAMRRMKGAPGHKEQAMQQAHMYRETERVVELFVGDDGQVLGRPILRSQVH